MVMAHFYGSLVLSREVILSASPGLAPAEVAPPAYEDLMPPFPVDPAKVREFKDADSFYKWLAKHHAKEDEIWIKIHKVNSGLKSITPKEAIDVVLCWGWIDAVRKRFDNQSYLQRYTPRGKKSIWSQINVANVARLIEKSQMTEH